jgi:methylthioribose-1-phosphate isomerase
VIDDGADLASHGPITLGLIAADRVSPVGSLVNGIPSLAFANPLTGVAPLYGVCETFKLDDGEQLEDGCDMVPANLVPGYVTDRGVSQPPQVWALRQSNA